MNKVKISKTECFLFLVLMCMVGSVFRIYKSFSVLL